MNIQRLAISLAITSLFACKKSSPTIQPEKKDITQAVYASGKVIPLNHYVVYSKFTGYVENIYVTSGDTISINDPLISIRNEANEQSINTAANLLELAKLNADENGSQLAAAREELSAAKSRYELDSLTFSRNSALQREDAISQQLFDQSRTQLDISRSTYHRLKEVYTAQRDRLRTEYQNALNQSKAQQSLRGDYRLLAVAAGKVYDVLPEIGDLVMPQTPLMEIGDANQFEVELSIDETDIGLVKTGQTVLLGIDAYPDQAFEGTIKEIYPKVVSNSKSSRAKATITTIDSKPLYSGMSVEGNIIIQTKKSCLVIPREYLKNNNYVQVKGESELRKITKGIEDLQYVEILKGLNENESIEK
jgi:hypothetical protein